MRMSKRSCSPLALSRRSRVSKDLQLKDQSWIDDGWKIDWISSPHESKLYARKSQIDRDAILYRNAELRKNPGIIRDSSFARYTLSIPLEDYEVLKKKYPVLVNGSNAERSAFYKKFIRATESLPYRVQG